MFNIIEARKRLEQLNKTKAGWEFGGASEERMKWIDEEIAKLSEQIKNIHEGRSDLICHNF